MPRKKKAMPLSESVTEAGAESALADGAVVVNPINDEVVDSDDSTCSSLSTTSMTSRSTVITISEEIVQSTWVPPMLHGPHPLVCTQCGKLLNDLFLSPRFICGCHPRRQEYQKHTPMCWRKWSR